MNHPALLERFVLKHGVEFRGVKRPKGVRKRKMKECFKNSTYGLWEKYEWDYYEGYAMNKRIAFPFLHAWNVKDGVLIDTTLVDPEEYEYIGVKFTQEQIWKEQLKTGVYGMLDIGMINLELLRSIDNELVEEGLRIHRNRGVHLGGEGPSTGTGHTDLGSVDGSSGSESSTN